MPVTRKPQTDTIGYTIDTAIADAWRFVTETPLAEHRAISDESRVAFHAILNYFRELGVGREDRKKIIELFSDGETAEFERGWSKGWDAGWESAKEQSLTPPF
jgi:hypothetical protein